MRLLLLFLTFFLYGIASGASAVEFTAEEKAWIAAHPVLRVASSRSYGPFTYVDEAGQVRGISVDYLQRLEKITGLKLELQAPTAFADSMAKLKSGELDLMMSLRDTAERREFLSFTRPYITVPAVLLRRAAPASAPQPGELRPGESVSVSRSYAVGPFLADRYPDNPQSVEPDDRTVLRRLAGGEIAAGVMDLAGATFLMRTEGIGNVRVAGDVGFAYDLAIGYRHELPMLGRILQKALDQIGAEERQAIADRWIRVDGGDTDGLPTGRVMAIAGLVFAAVLAVAALLLVWNRALRRQVAARTEQLQQELAERRRLQDADHARAMAELANKAKTEFMSQASHELRTPLNAVLGFSQLLENDPKRPLDELQMKRVGLIEDAARHLLVLIDDMMHFSRLESGSLSVETRPLAVEDILQRCVELAQPAAAAGGIRLAHEPAAQALPRVLADPVRLEQIMHNLLSNAIKYNQPGGWARVRASVESGGRVLAIEVADGGLGLSHEQQAQLFQPFNRLGRSALEGTGIGLVICKQLAERMGGRIRVSSLPGEGSRFTLELRTAPA